MPVPRDPWRVVLFPIGLFFARTSRIIGAGATVPAGIGLVTACRTGTETPWFSVCAIIAMCCLLYAAGAQIVVEGIHGILKKRADESR